MLYNKETIFKYRDRAQQKREGNQTEAIVDAGRQRRGLAVRDTEVFGAELEQARDNVKRQEEARTSVVDDWFSTIYEDRAERNRSFEEEMGFEPLGDRAQNRRTPGTPETTAPVSESTRRRFNNDLTRDEGFMGEITRLASKYNRPVSEFLKVIQGESSFIPNNLNEDSGASGLFQFIPSTAEMLGTDTKTIRRMTPVEQVKLYERYLDKFGYKGDNALGIMQAAPAFANRSANSVIYRVGSKAWEQNPGWRESRGGPITVASINRYYERQA